MKKWTSEDNYTSLGYLKFAIEYYNECSVNGAEHPIITESQAHKLIGCMHTAFDRHSEKEAYEKE